MRCEIKKSPKAFNSWSIKLTDITEGMLMSLVSGMQNYAPQSAVGTDVYRLIQHTWDEAKKQEEQCQVTKPV